jgi:uncharacterized protein
MTPNSLAPDVASPCINVCTLDAASVCIGCGRTIDEIARWSGMNAEERRQVCINAVERCRQRLRGAAQ